MKIVINERQFNHITQQDINERLGVPTNIENVANLLYTKILSEINDYDSRDEINGNQDNMELIMYLNSDINDLHINNININLDFHKVETDEIEIDAMGYIREAETIIGKHGSYVTKTSSLDENLPAIMFQIVIPNHKITTFNELKKLFIYNKSWIISSIAHELKHVYDYQKNKYESIDKATDYISYTRVRSGLKSFDSFLTYLYYSNNVENLTRATEVFVDALENKVTKKDFRDYLIFNPTYQMLIRLRDFKVDNMINEIKENHIKEITNLLFNRGIIKTRELPEDEIINKFLILVHINISNRKMERLNELLENFSLANLFDLMIPETNVSYGNEYLKKVLNKLEKEQVNILKYYYKKEKYMNLIGDKYIRKIAKVYDLLPDTYEQEIDETKKSIKNWDLYHKIKKTKVLPYKTLPKIKKPRRK